jgi:hypothetical protein
MEPTLLGSLARACGRGSFANVSQTTPVEGHVDNDIEWND